MDRPPPESTEGPGRDAASGEAPDRNDDRVELAALEVGGGAAAGAVLGRILGGGAKGTLIGAVVGAAAGAALTLGTRTRRTGEDRASRKRPRPAPSAPGDGQPARERARERLEGWTKARLYEAAKELEIPGRSGMNKAELIGALQRHPGFTAA